MTSSFVSGYNILSNSKFFISGGIWLKFGSGDIFWNQHSESGVIFHIRGQYQADIGHFLQFCLRNSDKHSLTIGLLWQQLKSQINKTYIFGCSNRL